MLNSYHRTPGGGGGIPNGWSQISIDTGATLYDPNTMLNGVDIGDVTFADGVMTIPIDEAIGYAADPKDMIGVVVPLYDIYNALVSAGVGRGDTCVAGFILTGVPTSAWRGIAGLCSASTGPLDANSIMASDLHLNTTNAEVSSWRGTGAGHNERVSTTHDANTRGAIVELIQGSGSSGRITASARTSSFVPITTTNTGTIDDVHAVGDGLTHAFCGFMITAAFTGSLTISAGAFVAAHDSKVTTP